MNIFMQEEDRIMLREIKYLKEHLEKPNIQPVGNLQNSKIIYVKPNNLFILCCLCPLLDKLMTFDCIIQRIPIIFHLRGFFCLFDLWNWCSVSCSEFISKLLSIFFTEINVKHHNIMIIK